MPRSYQSLVEIAIYLRRSPSTIRRLIRRTRDPLPGKKVGGEWLFDTAKVDVWYDRQPGNGGEDLNID